MSKLIQKEQTYSKPIVVTIQGQLHYIVKKIQYKCYNEAVLVTEDGKELFISEVNFI